jgi:hypothetical protein
MAPSLQIGWFGPSHGPWGWIQSHFDNLTQLDPSRIDEWCSDSKRSDRSVSHKLLLVALEHRSDVASMESVIARSAEQGKTAIAFLLGNDWHGHRRTYPIPEGITAFYWYQWYDQVFPWISELHSQMESGVKIDPQRRRKGKGPASQSDTNVAWRVRWGMERSSWLANAMQSLRSDAALAWVITDHSDQSSMWQDACSSLGLQMIASRWDRDPAWFDPQLIIVDSLSRSKDSDLSIESMVQSVRRRHPEACLVVVTPFPTWEQWNRWQSLGVDAILPRPAFVQGFLFYWQHWKTRSQPASSF